MDIYAVREQIKGEYKLYESAVASDILCPCKYGIQCSAQLP